MDKYAAEELQDAKDVLSDAKKLRDAGGTDESIVNRQYYACFHAAKAVLYTEGYNPTTHRGVVRVFGQEIIENGEATRDDGKFLSDLQDNRNTADYEHNPVNVDIDEVFERTEKFVADMEDIVKGK